VLALGLAGIAPLQVPSAVLAAVLDASATIAVGVTVFARTAVPNSTGQGVERERLRRIVLLSALVGAGAVVIALLVEVSRVGGAPRLGLGSAAAWDTLADSGYLSAGVLRILGLALLATAARVAWRRVPASILAGVGSAVSLVPYAMVGHGAAAPPQPLMAAVIVTHVGFASVWLGGVVGLAVALRARHGAGDLPGATEIAHRFSILMTVVLLVVLGTGSLASWFLLAGSPRNLYATSYGAVLLLKLLLVGAVIVLGGVNHQRVIPRLRAGVDGAWALLLRNSVLEVVMLVTVVLVSSLLATSPSPE
jgi:copper transport protein